MSTHAQWRGLVQERIWPAARALAVRVAHGLWSLGLQWIAAPLAAQLRRAVSRPLRILASGLVGMAYAATVATLVSSLLAFLLGLTRAWPAWSELHDAILVGVAVLLPVAGWTIGYLALGVGAIVGVGCAAAGGGLWAGLEWASVGGVGAALGLGVAFGSWDLVGLGAVAGAILSGSTGLITWLCFSDHKTLRVERSTLAPYLAATLLIALYVPLVLDWILGTLSG